MSQTIKITGLHPQANGEWPFDPPFTLAEYHDIKRISGIRSNEIADALDAGDSDIYVAFASCALKRNGVDFPERILWASPGGQAIKIEIVITADEEEQTGPPTVPTSSESSATVGDSSTPGLTTSAATPNDPRATGAPASDIGASSDPVILPA